MLLTSRTFTDSRFENIVPENIGKTKKTFFLTVSVILPPAVLKVHTAAYHFLGNGKIRRFGCSLLFSGVASVTHGGLQEALSGL